MESYKEARLLLGDVSLLSHSTKTLLFLTRGKLFHALGWGCESWGLSRRGGGVGGAEWGSPMPRTVVYCRRFLCGMECWEGMVGECAEDEELVEDEDEFLRSRRIGFWWRMIDSIYWRGRQREGRWYKHNGYLLFCKWRINFPSIDYNAWNKAQIWSWLSWNGLETLRFLQWDTGRGCPCLSPSSPSPAVFSVPLSLGVPDVAGPPSVATQPTICNR